MNDNRCLTRIHGVPDVRDDIIDAEFVEIDDPVYTSSPKASRVRGVGKRGNRYPWYIKGFVFLLLLVFILMWIGAVFGDGGNQADNQTEPAELSASSDEVSQADSGVEAVAANVPPIEDAPCLRTDVIKQVGRKAASALAQAYIAGNGGNANSIDPDQVKAMFRTAHISLSQVMALNNPQMADPYPCTGSVRIAMNSKALGRAVMTIPHARWKILFEDGGLTKGYASAPFIIDLNSDSLIAGMLIDGKPVELKANEAGGGQISPDAADGKDRSN